MSAIKAQAVVDFLAQFSELPAEEEKPAEIDAPAATETLPPAYIQAVALLTHPAACEFRGQLLRELARFAGLLKTDCPPPEVIGSGKLARAVTALNEALAAPELDRKAQTALAERLAEISDRITLPAAESPAAETVRAPEKKKKGKHRDA
jgi:hypothetical protein